MHLDLENSLEEPPTFKSDPFFILPSFQSESSTPSTGGFSGKDTPSEDDRSQLREHGGESLLGLRAASGDGLMLPPSPKVEKKDPSKKKEWWENAGNKIYTMAADRTISKLMTEYKRRKQQHNLPTFPKDGKGEKKGEVLGPRGPDSPLPQRPQHLMDQGQMRHSLSAGPELLRQDKRPRSGSTGSSLSISIRDAEAQIQVRQIPSSSPTHSVFQGGTKEHTEPNLCLLKGTTEAGCCRAKVKFCCDLFTPD